MAGSKSQPKISQSHRAGLRFPIGRVGRFIRKGKYSENVGASSAIALASIMEYLITEISDLSGSHAEAINKHRIVPKIIFQALQNDPQLEELFVDSVIGQGGARETYKKVLDQKKTKSQKRKKRSKSQSSHKK